MVCILQNSINNIHDTTIFKYYVSNKRAYRISVLYCEKEHIKNKGKSMKCTHQVVFGLIAATLLFIGCGESPTDSDPNTLSTPTITTQPSQQTVVMGDTAKFSVLGTGGELEYQWYIDNNPISGATENTFNFVPLQSDSGASVTVVITNDSGSDTSSAVTISVVSQVIAPAISTQPNSVTVQEDSMATFTVVASGTGLSYQWKENGTAIPGETNASYSKIATKSDSGNSYVVDVYNSEDTISSDTVSLTVLSEGGAIPANRTAMKLIPAAGQTFKMGIKDSIQPADYTSQPEHDVTLTKNFWMDSVEVTAEKYSAMLNWAYANGHIQVVKEYGNSDGAYNVTGTQKRLMHLNVSTRVVKWNSTDEQFYAWSTQSGLPMNEVYWHGAAFYCNMLSLQDGLEPTYDLNTWECDFSKNGYRLPTEAEYEFALRGGTETAWFWGGDSIAAPRYAHYDAASSIPTGSLDPNPYGLYDITGNAKEWCNDWYDEDFYTSNAEIDPKGPVQSVDVYNYKVQRGFNNDARALRSGCRGASNAGSQSNGFRIILPE